MKKQIKPLCNVTIGLLLLSLYCCFTASAQVTPPKVNLEINDTAYFDLTRDITEQLVPFEEIYQAALKFSPLLQVQNSLTNSKLEAYRYSKVLALDNVYPFMSYVQGNQTLIATGTNPTDGLQLSNGTRWGFNVQLPLSTILGRHNLVNQAKAEYQAAQNQKAVIGLGLKRELIKVYQDLVVAQRIMNTRLRDEQVSLTSYRLAEIELRENKIVPSELAIISNTYTQSKSYAERARGDFMTNYYDLEALVGVPLRTLMLK